MTFSVHTDISWYGPFPQTGLGITLLDENKRVGYLRIMPQGGSIAPLTDTAICMIYLQTLGQDVEKTESDLRKLFPAEKKIKDRRPTPARDQSDFYLDDPRGDAVDSTFTIPVLKDDAKKVIERIKNIEDTVFNKAQELWYKTALSFIENPKDPDHPPSGSVCAIQ